MILGCIAVLVLVIAGVHLGMYFMSFTDAQASQYFEKHHFTGNVEYIRVHDRECKLICEESTPKDEVLIVYIHGAPGTWDAFKQYLVDSDLNEKARVIAYDRPGYGGSGEQAMTGITDQIAVVQAIIRTYGLTKNIVVGHSYGGPIAGLVGVDTDLNIDAAIMIAPLNDPESEPIFWVSYFAYWKATAWMLPAALRVAGAEKFAHAEELTKVLPLWKKVDYPVIHIHGKKDQLAPCIPNLTFSKQHIPARFLNFIEYEEKGHLMLWTDYEEMKEVILRAIH